MANNRKWKISILIESLFGKKGTEEARQNLDQLSTKVAETSAKTTEATQAVSESSKTFDVATGSWVESQKKVEVSTAQTSETLTKQKEKFERLKSSAMLVAGVFAGAYALGLKIATKAGVDLEEQNNVIGKSFEAAANWINYAVNRLVKWGSTLVQWSGTFLNFSSEYRKFFEDLRSGADSELAIAELRAKKMTQASKDSANAAVQSAEIAATAAEKEASRNKAAREQSIDAIRALEAAQIGAIDITSSKADQALKAEKIRADAEVRIKEARIAWTQKDAADAVIAADMRVEAAKRAAEVDFSTSMQIIPAIAARGAARIAEAKTNFATAQQIAKIEQETKLEIERTTQGIFESLQRRGRGFETMAAQSRKSWKAMYDLMTAQPEGNAVDDAYFEGVRAKNERILEMNVAMHRASLQDLRAFLENEANRYEKGSEEEIAIRKKIYEIDTAEREKNFQNLSQIFSLTEQYLDQASSNKLARFEREKEKELSVVGLSEARKAAISAKYAKKEEQEKRKAFKRHQIFAVAEIAVNTAKAIMAVAPDVYEMAAMAIFGAAQAAIVLSQSYQGSAAIGRDRTKAGIIQIHDDEAIVPAEPAEKMRRVADFLENSVSARSRGSEASGLGGAYSPAASASILSRPSSVVVANAGEIGGGGGTTVRNVGAELNGCTVIAQDATSFGRMVARSSSQFDRNVESRNTRNR